MNSGGRCGHALAAWLPSFVLHCTINVGCFISHSFDGDWPQTTKEKKMSALQTETRTFTADRAPAPAPRYSLRRPLSRRVQLQPARPETRLFHAL